MADGIYAAVSGALAQAQALDVVSNNLANAPTAGFKAEGLAFREVLAGAVDQQSVLRQVTTDQSYTDFSGGKIAETGNPLDVAIVGDGFFVVQTQGGERYTRAGGMSVGSDGTLLSAAGHTVMGEGGPISIPSGKTIEIKSNGLIASGQNEIGKLRVVDFENPERLVREGGLWRDGGGAGSKQIEADLRSGAIEGSNVNVVAMMTELVRVSRAYEVFNKAIENFRAMDRRASNDLGG